MHRLLLIGTVLLLAGCESREESRARAEQELMHANALKYRKMCVEAIERYRARFMPDSNTIPRTLHGATCESSLLGDYRLLPEVGRTVKSSLIEVDTSRLSGYTIKIEGKNGKTYTYVDRGVTAAMTEQAGTLDGSADPLSMDSESDESTVTR